MNRRNFLKTVGACSIAAAIPIQYREGSTLRMSDITITYADDGDWGVIIDAGNHTMLEVQEFIHENFRV